MDKKVIISVVTLTLLSMTMPHPAVQAAEQNNSAVAPAVNASDTKSAADEGASSVPVADLAEGKEVREALEQLIHAYETGNISLIQSSIDPTMMGYQRFLDGVRQDVLRLRQIRVELLNTQIVVGPDVAVVQTDWEKRFLAAYNLAPGKFSGHSILLMHRGKEGWRMAAFSGDNMFASQGGTLGQISTVPTAFTWVTIPGFPGLPLQIEVIDPDLSNRASLTVQATTGQGDRESVVLTSTTPGRFAGSVSVINQSTFSAGSGSLEVTGPTTIYIRYLDNNPGNNRPPSMLTKVVPVR